MSEHINQQDHSRKLPHLPSQTQPEWALDVEVKMICPYCRESPANLIEEYSCGDTICGSCGLVMESRMIDTRAEWRTFSNDDSNSRGADRNRVGEAPDLLNNGSLLDTEIGHIKGKNDPKTESILRTQRKVHNVDKSKSLSKAYVEIDAYCAKIGIQDNVRDLAKLIFKKVDNDMKGKSRLNYVYEAAVASCILIACRQCKVDRTFREIFLLTNVPKKDIGRTFKKIEKLLCQEPVTASSTINKPYVMTSHTDATLLMIRFCNVLGFDARFTLAAQELAKKMNLHTDFCARSPLNVAGTAIYVIAKITGKALDQNQVSKVIGISASSISTGFRAVNVHKNHYFDYEWLLRFECDLDSFPVLTSYDLEKYERYQGPGSVRPDRSRADTGAMKIEPCDSKPIF